MLNYDNNSFVSVGSTHNTDNTIQMPNCASANMSSINKGIKEARLKEMVPTVKVIINDPYTYSHY